MSTLILISDVTSEIKISVLIDAAYAIRTLHGLYGLGQRLISWCPRWMTQVRGLNEKKGHGGPGKLLAIRTNGGWVAAGGDAERGGNSPRITPSEPALRIILRRLREIMAEPSDGQSRPSDRRPSARSPA